MFSSRTIWQTKTNPLFTLLEKKKAKGEKILNFAESNPTRAGIKCKPEEILNPFQNIKNLDYNPDPRGILPAREAVSSYYSERNVNFPPERLLLTASTSEAYSFIFKLLCNPGDNVLIPRPGYPLFDYLAALEGVNLSHYPLEYIHPGGWIMDMDALKKSVNDKTRAVVVIHPNNPTGSFIRPEEMEVLCALCAERNIAIISDEVFSDYDLDLRAGTVKSFGNRKDALCFILSGFSKILGLPQMKLGWIGMTGPEGLVQEAYQNLELISDTFLSVHTPIQNAASEYFKLVPEFQSTLKARLKTNFDFLKQKFHNSPFRVLQTEGGWTALIQAPEIMNEEEWTLGLLQEENLFTFPGYFFEFEKGVHLSASLLLPADELKDGAEKILRFLAHH